MRKKVTLVPLFTLILLLIIGFIGAIERGPLTLSVYVGAHPANEGPMGLSELYKMLRANFSVILVNSWKDVKLEEKCRVLIVIVSPELPYTGEEAARIAEAVRACEEVRLLVADETGNANPILAEFGSEVRIGTNALREYPLVAVDAPWGSYVLLLDRPSPLFAHGNAEAIGIEIGVQDPQVYAFLESRGLVWGDGSVFLNQVLRSENSIYREFVRDTLSYLCNNCTILLDATKAQAMNPLDFFHGNVSPEVVPLVDPFSLLISLLSHIIHPSNWFFPLARLVNALVADLLVVSPLRELIIVATFIVLSLFISSRESSERDVPLREVTEVHWYGYSALKDKIMKGGSSLKKDDFVALYELLDYLLLSTAGVSLSSPEAASVLQNRGMSSEKAKALVEFMNKYYRRATGKSLWPPVVFWNSTTRKAISLTEEALKVLGYSLMEARGIEGRVL
ncbi:MAG: hypothetical protein NZ902_03210 [Acidilobaceae archaeon]|nr:hypothetical protein [Acidilobaceae archaeon]MCX8165828.1 hypothetical protein [Acidilobaceae archaeon]MDW7974252.1 hypothetical protein [Sulfolobales archaeon]